MLFRIKKIALFDLNPTNILISNLSDITTLKLKIVDFDLMKDVSKNNKTIYRIN